MMETSVVEGITEMLEKMGKGDRSAANRLLTAVYDEMRVIAAAKMHQEPRGLTLQPTALVHEAWLRMGGDEQPVWNNRAHFFGAAAEAMRRILIERARRRQAMRHGGGQVRIEFDTNELAAPGNESDEQMLALNEALEKFTTLAPEKAKLVKLRYFAGLKIEETARILGISEPTAKRWWTYARSWLLRELRPNG